MSETASPIYSVPAGSYVVIRTGRWINEPAKVVVELPASVDVRLARYDRIVRVRKTSVDIYG